MLVTVGLSKEGKAHILKIFLSNQSEVGENSQSEARQFLGNAE